MKYLAIPFIVCIAVGCKHNEFDVSPDQVAKHTNFKGPEKGAFLDMKHLPPGAEVHTMKFKKGDQLPDGRIADGDVVLKKIEIKGKGPKDGKAPNQQIINEDVLAK